VIGVGLAVEGCHDGFDVLFGEHIVVGHFLEESSGIDELGFSICFVFREHQNVDRNGGAEEEVGCQGDHGLDVVVVDQILADLLFGSTPVEDAREADDGGAAFTGEVAQCMEHKGEVGLGLGSQHAGGGEAFIVDQGGVVGTLPLNRVGWIGDDGIEGLVVAKVRFEEGVAQLHLELMVIDVVQEHVHAGQVVGSVVDLLAKKALFDDILVKVLLGLQQERSRAAGWVVDFVDVLPLMPQE